MNPLLELLGYAGNVLDAPGSMVRGLLAGDVEGAFAGLTDTSRRWSGRDLLEGYGVLDPNEEGLDWGDVAGTGVDLLADPLNFLGWVGLTKGIQHLRKGSGVIPEASRAGEAVSILGQANDASPDLLEGIYRGAGGAGTRGGEAALDDLTDLALNNQGPIQAHQLGGMPENLDTYGVPGPGFLDDLLSPPPGSAPDALGGYERHMAPMGSDPEIELQRALRDFEPPPGPDIMPGGNPLTRFLGDESGTLHFPDPFAGAGDAPKSPVFYSRLEEAINTLPKQLNAQSVMNKLMKAPGGVAKEELDWVGVPKLLEGRTGPVTKEELLKHFQENKITLGETNYTGGSKAIWSTPEDLDTLETRLEGTPYVVRQIKADGPEPTWLVRESKTQWSEDSGAANR